MPLHEISGLTWRCPLTVERAHVMSEADKKSSKIRARILGAVLGLLVGVFFPSVTSAEVNGMCCGKWVTLSEAGSGFARNWTCERDLPNAPEELKERVCRQLRETDAVCPERVAKLCTEQEKTDCPDPLQEQAAKKILQAIYPGIKLPARLSPGLTIFAFEALRRLNEASRITAGLSKLLPTKPIRSLSQIGKMLAKAAIEAFKDHHEFKMNRAVYNVLMKKQRVLRVHVNSLLKTGSKCRREEDPPEFYGAF